MVQMVVGMLLKLAAGYIAKLATEQFAHYALFKIAEAVVKSTATQQDDNWLRAVKNTVEGRAPEA